jgi:hypothetical protein
VDRIVEAWRRERPDLDLAALALLGRLFRTAHLGSPCMSLLRAMGAGDRPCEAVSQLVSGRAALTGIAVRMATPA